jgi:predicted O-methyltransferase YrrM
MNEPLANAGACSLHDPRVANLLARLHAEARGQRLELAKLVPALLGDLIARRESSVSDEVARLKNLYVPVSPKQGRFLYSAARSIGARRVVEFGSSFGISATYLAAAVRDNGGGIVIGSELEPNKVATARRNLGEAGLDGLVEIREGDARETLRDPGGSVDLVFLDGFKQLYLPVLQMLIPHLRSGSIVIADNIFTFRVALAPYVSFVQDPANGFLSMTLFLGDGTEHSLRL